MSNDNWVALIDEWVELLICFNLCMKCLVIASQAIITGCFSLLSQAGSLGFCPPLDVKHTSETMFGQIYVPVS